MLIGTSSYAQLFAISECLATVDSNANGPMYSAAGANATSRTAALYPSSQLTGIAGQTLNSLYYKRLTANGVMAGTPNFKVYMKEVTITDFGAGELDWATAISGATLVYDSNPAAAVGSTAGFKSFPMSTNFIYSGTQNLAVFTQYTNSTASANIGWAYEYQAPCISTTNNNTGKFTNNTTGTLPTTLATSNYRRAVIGFDYLVSCNAPNTVVASNVTTTSAVVSWTENTTQPQNGYEYYLSTSATAPIATTVPTGTTATGVATVSLASLPSSTTHYFWVRGNCGAADKSIWIGPLSFTTPCTVQTIPFSEEFETITSGIPNCWGIAGTTTTPAYNFASFATGNTGKGLRFNSYSNSNGSTSELTTPVLDATVASTLRLVFYFKNPTGGNFEVLVSSDGGNTYTSLENNLTGVTDWTLKTYNITSAISNNVRVKFKGTSNYGNGDAYIYLDGVVIEQIPTNAPNCSAIVTPTNGAINISSGKITWATNIDATGYKISAGTSAGTTNVLNMFDVGNVTNYTIPTDPGTTYYVTLFPYNANGTSTGCNEISFTTCDAFPVPFMEGFNSTSTTESCWTVLNVNNDTDAWDLNYATSPIEGNQSAMLFTDGNAGNNDDWLISPKITLNGNQRVKFQRKVQSASEPNDFRMLVSTTGVAPADFTTVILPLTAYSNNIVETMTVSLAGISGNAHIAWHVPAGGLDGWRLYIDDVVVEDIPNVIPTCSTITSPLDNAFNVMNSTVTWTPSLDAAGYKIYVGYNSGTTEVLNGVDTAGLTSYSIPTDSGTTYWVTVVPYNATGAAVGCSEISFTTCDLLNAPFLEPFNTFLPACWSNMQGGDLASGPTSTGVSRWVADGFANVGTTGAIRAEIWTTGANSWVISPVVSIPATGYELKLDAAATQFGNANAPTNAWESDDYIQVLVSATGTNNWMVLHTYDNTNQPSNTGTPLIVGLSAYAGQDVRFALRAFEGATNGSADIDFSIDNFEVRLTPSSVPLCATNIVATPNATCGNYANTITWDAVSGADGYSITIGTASGGSNVLNNVNVGNTTTYSFVGSLSTTYYYTVVPFNTAGVALGCTEYSFTTIATGCYCPSTPTSVDGLGITNVQIGSTNFINTVSYGPVYSNNTTPIDMFQGISNNVQVSFDTDYGYNYHVVIWVDANDNYTFEPSEIFYTGVSLDDPTTTLNASFVMPSATPLGNHRMRIVATYDQQIPSNPCYGASYGETVDFIVNVVATASSNSFDNANFVAYPNPVKDVYNVSYSSEISSLRVLNLLGQEVVSKAVNATSTQVDMSQLSAGTYIVNVTVGDSIKSIKVIKQ